MKAIEVEANFLSTLPSAYIQTDAVVLVGIDGEERTPWLSELSVADLIKLLED